MTTDEARELQRAWQEVLLVAGEGDWERFARLRDIFERAYAAGCDRKQPVTLVAVAASPLTGPIPPCDSSRPTIRLSPNDVFISRHDPNVDVSPVGPAIFMHIIGGTRRGPIWLPIHVFLFDDKGHAVQGAIAANGDWSSLPF